MGGTQQIDKLFRKNILLKCRRPRATCFELLLPLVLFVFLAIIRKEYEKQVWYYGPVRFESNPVFPQTRRLMDMASGLVSFDLSVPSGPGNQSLQGLGGLLHQQLLCNPQLQEHSTQLLEKTLSLPSPSMDGKTVARYIMGLDANQTADSIRQHLEDARSTNISQLADQFEEFRTDYFSSSWPNQTQTAADGLQSEWEHLQAELRENVTAGLLNGSDAVRRRVDGWLNDTCHMRGPVFEGFNTSELAKHLETFHELMNTSGLVSFINESRSTLESLSLVDWFDDYMDSVNNTVTIFRIDEAIDRMNASELKTWLLDIRAGMDAPGSMAWFNKTIDAIDNSSEIKSWLVEFKDFLNASNATDNLLNDTLGHLNATGVRTWLLRICDMLNTTAPAHWFNVTLDDIDTPELRNHLADWLEQVARAMNETRQMNLTREISHYERGGRHHRNRTWHMDTTEVSQRLNRLQRMLNTTAASLGPIGALDVDVVQDIMLWMSHFTVVGTPFANLLTASYDLTKLLRGDSSQHLSDPILNMSLHRFTSDFNRLSAEFNGTWNHSMRERNMTMWNLSDIQHHLNQASDVVSRLEELLRQANGSSSLSTLVHQAFAEADMNRSLHDMVDHTIRQISHNGTLLEEVEKALRNARLGGHLAGEVIDALKQVNLSADFQQEVHRALERVNITGAIEMELSALTNWSMNLSSDVLHEFLNVNLSGSLRSQLADIVARANISNSFDAHVTKVLHELRSSIRTLDSDVVGWRSSLDRLFKNGTWTEDRLQEFVLDAIHNLTGRNATQIEQDLFAHWKDSWQTQCLQINSSQVAEMILSHQDDLKAIERFNISRTVRGLYTDLRQFNVSDVQRPLESLQEAAQNLNVTHISDSARELVTQAQSISAAVNDSALAHDMALNLMGRYHAELISAGVKCTVPENSELSWLAQMFGSALGISVEEPPRSGRRRGGGGRGRRLQSGLSDFLLNELLRRKILVAPYKGEVKELWDLFLVELVVMLTATETGAMPNELGEEILNNPGLRGGLAKALQVVLQDLLMTFPTERELEEFAIERPDDVFAAIVFRSADENTGNFPADSLDVRYAIRLHAQLMPDTDRVLRYVRFSLFGGVGGDADPYMTVGFAFVQDSIGRATARFRAKREAAATPAIAEESEVYKNTWANNATALVRRLSVSTEQFPTPRYKVDYFIYFIQFMLPMLMVMGWIYTVSLLVKEMVYEKQERLREVMRIQGLRTWVYWLSWIAFAMSQLMVMVVIAVLILTGSRVLQHSNPLVVLLYFTLYSASVVSFAMLISSCFNHAKVAAVCAGVAYFSAYLPYPLFTRYEETASIGLKCLFCLLCPTGMSVGISMIAKWELLEEGIQFGNLGSTPMITNTGALPNNDFSMLHVMGMLILDTFVYQLAAWYIEKVFPGELGLPQPWYFPFMRSYWRGQAEVEQNLIEEGSNPEKDDNLKLDCYESAPNGLTTSVQIRKLEKMFSAGKRALKGISLDMQQGTILGLLGHNGAGKSTTMSILTGLYPPTSGDVRVHGVSVKKDSAGVRKQLGVCLQHNALYDILTVNEHLDIFCNLKSVPRKEVPAQVAQLVQDIGLAKKQGAPTRALSGGMKRKLSIGIALAGGSKVIALDEPTAGVDATSRRDIWQLLATYKKDRSILLSTHFMDEADVLSDRIAIIAEGQLTAIGSSISLKKHFADRYLLTIVAADRAQTSMLLAAVRKIVPEARSVGTRGREHSFALPSGTRSSFAGLFTYLEDAAERTRLGVETYGLSAPTMEEVFLVASSTHEEGLKGVVRNGAETPPSDTASTASGSATRPSSADTPPRLPSKDEVLKEDASFGDSASTGSSPVAENNAVVMGVEPPPFSPQCISGPSEPEPAPKPKLADITSSPKHGSDKEQDNLAVDSGPLLQGPPLLWQQFKARVLARAVSARRDRRAWGSQIFLPSVFVLLALVVAAILEVVEEQPPLKLTTDMFIGSASGSRHSLSEHLIPMTEAYSNAFTAQIAEAFHDSKRPADRLERVMGNDSMWEDSTGVIRDYIMVNKQDLRSRAYGAINVAGEANHADVTLFYDSRGAHITPAMLHMCNNARLKLLGYEDTYTEAWSHPLPMTQALIEEQLNSNSQVFTSLTVAITVLLAMGFIPASFVVYIVHEKATNAKHQQLLTGVSPVMYWVSTYFWDIINYTLPVLFIFLLFLVFQLDAYSGANAPGVLVVLLVYGIAMTPQMYCLEPLFSVPSTAYVTCIVLNIFTGFVSLQITTVLTLVQTEMPHLEGLNSFLETVFMWTLPNYCLGRAFLEIATNHYIRFAAEEFNACFDPDICGRSSLDWRVSGKYIFTLCISAAVWFAIRLLIEWRCFLRFFLSGRETPGPKSGLEDRDVLEEAKRVDKALQDPLSRDTSNEGSLVIQNLSKTFTRARWNCCRRRVENVHSVRGISTAVGGGECFGLLGVNGAGKTTTMRMITGDIEVGCGDVLLSGWSVKTHRDQARRHLGYCPQFDALTDKLTTREALRFYARIRGVAPSKIEQVVEAMVKRMCLEAHQHRLCQHLSGGNKRKLSTALALIGEPDVVLLDEPSTGVDVGARRFLWEVIGGVRRHGHAVVLTSHSMDECEVLCTRLTIMVSGEMRCLGTPLQLKSKYGGGYTLAIKARQATQSSLQQMLQAVDLQEVIEGHEVKMPSEDPSTSIRNFMKDKIPMARLAEENVGLFRYRLGGNDATTEPGREPSNHKEQEVQLAELFSALEGAMSVQGALEDCVLDYTVSQTSLEEVFLYFSQL